MSRGIKELVTTGPGYLFRAILGSAEPTNTAVGGEFTDAWPAAWFPIGYTAEGSTFGYSPSYDPLEVAEELDQLDSIPTGREIKVTFAAAENTAQNYKLAMNGGIITVTGAAPNQVVSFEPPELGGETQTMLGFESEDHAERLVWRQCKQTGSGEMNRRKGADKLLLPMDFNVYAPAAGGKPFERWSCRPAEIDALA